MGLLDGLPGVAARSELVPVVNGLMEKHGGLPGMVAHLQRQGLGPAVRSWVGTGRNLPISADHVYLAFGTTTLTELAVRLGVSPLILAQHLSELLPQAIDYLTPAGAFNSPPAASDDPADS